MSGLFGGNDAPAVPVAPPAPTINDAEASAQAKTDELRRRRGMASTILAGAQPASNTTPQTRAAGLLGS
jgi:hypothetical protein